MGVNTYLDQWHTVPVRFMNWRCPTEIVRPPPEGRIRRSAPGTLMEADSSAATLDRLYALEGMSRT
jgi:hypothetical protein